MDNKELLERGHSLYEVIVIFEIGSILYQCERTDIYFTIPAGSKEITIIESFRQIRIGN